MRYLLIFTFLFLMGCSPDVPGTSLPDENSPTGTPLQTDKTLYEARYLGGEGVYKMYGFKLEASFSNTYGKKIYLNRCLPDSPTPIYWLRLSNEGDSGYNAPWACVGHDEFIEVEPGGTYQLSLDVEGPNSWSGTPRQAYGILEGRFEFIIETVCKGGSKTCSPEELVSNEFEVRLEE